MRELQTGGENRLLTDVVIVSPLSIDLTILMTLNISSHSTTAIGQVVSGYLAISGRNVTPG